MSDEPELLPCPFCGWAVESNECGNCGAHGPTVPNLGTPAEAWNTRAKIHKQPTTG